MSDWQFRILTGAESDFAADLNAMIVANGGYALTMLDDSGKLVSCLLPPGAVRMDFDVFPLPSGLHVNARLTTLQNAGAIAGAEATAFWSGAISSWFGESGTQPICRTLATFLNPTLGSLIDALQIGGQPWKSTGKTVLISPSPTVQKRNWE